MVRLPAFARLLSGVLLAQGAAALLTAAAMEGSWRLRLAALAMGGVVAVVIAFWFSGLLREERLRTRTRLEARFQKKADRLHRRTERQVRKLEAQSRQRLEKEQNRIQARANRKVALAFAGFMAAGGVMLFTQFMTLGLLVISGTGGALAGYLARGRRRALLPARNDPPLLEKR